MQGGEEERDRNRPREGDNRNDRESSRRIVNFQGGFHKDTCHVQRPFV